MALSLGQVLNDTTESTSSCFPSSSHAALHLKVAIPASATVPRSLILPVSTVSSTVINRVPEIILALKSPLKTQLKVPSTQDTVPAIPFEDCLCQQWEYKSCYLQDTTSYLKENSFSRPSIEIDSNVKVKLNFNLLFIWKLVYRFEKTSQRQAGLRFSFLY